MNKRLARCMGLALASIVLVSCLSCSRDSSTTKEKPMTPQLPTGEQVVQKAGYPFWIFLPEGYDPQGKSWPMILFLHGAGERGSDIEKVKVHGPPMMVETDKAFPFIVVSPQCPEGRRWQPETLIQLLDAVIETHQVDAERIYLTGLSMGGFGTWALAAAHPDRFAAIVPICGGGDPDQACRLKTLPTWVFHGAKDEVVPLSASQDMVTALQACDGNVRFTIYPDAGHNSWTQTYHNQELYAWFLKHRQPGR